MYTVFPQNLNFIFRIFFSTQTNLSMIFNIKCLFRLGSYFVFRTQYFFKELETIFST